MALAYLLGKSSAKLLKVNLNIPLILVLSILPDVDILFGVSALHRGPTHSLILALIVFIPFFALYRRKAAPYFLALISHSLISDFLIGGQLMLFWPLTSTLFGLNDYICIRSLENIALEWALFAVSTIVMFKTGDLSSFFRNKKSNLLLTIPIGTVLLPTFVSYPLQVPILLMPPHLFYLVLFSISVLTVIAGFMKKG
ncbi:metal-dependent hydrolase [Candidatus Bathyarchaeota archaeon]|nr:metal-dependent hydrolase [Candidatus Bathyarchaeota archaeon]